MSLESEKRATTVVLGIFSPMSNVAHALSYMLNMYRLACQDGTFVSPGHVLAYGGPIMYLFFQACALLVCLIWLEGEASLHLSLLLSLSERRKQGAADMELQAMAPIDDGELGDGFTKQTISAPRCLEVDGITHKFGRNQVLDDVTLEVPRGEVLGLLGCNGAGKSTLVNLIRGVMKPTKGEVRVCGKSALSMVAQKHIGGKLDHIIIRFEVPKHTLTLG
jgi:ATP-binding cassette, subfamily A (ABC1), member 3